MFLYRFVRRRRRRPPAADSCSRDNFWTTFGISFIFGTIVGPDLQITWLHFRRFSSWPWPRFFKVKYRICYISAKNGPIPTKRKANISIELWGSNVTSGFDLGHDLDLEFSRSNIEFAISQPKMVRLPWNEKQTYWLNSRPQMRPMVWIYQIVTGVISVVGMPSTHLVDICYPHHIGRSSLEI